MLKLDLILQIMNNIDDYLKEKIKKITGLMKDELGAEIMTKFVGLSANTHSYLIYDGSEDKKPKDTKKCIIKENLNLKIIKTV